MVDGRAMNVTVARPKENSGNPRGGFKKDNFWK
jgi:hypothetical protein